MNKGIGGMGQLFKQAQEMQARLAKIQEELAVKSVDASAGGGMVEAKVNGQLNLVSIKLDPAIVDLKEKGMLEDLILVAVNEGLRRAREMAAEEMGRVTGGLKIPGLTP